MPALGNMYLFPGEGDLATRWAVLAVHPDKPDLFFAVPVDGNPLFGVSDIQVREAGRRLTVRCGLGQWMPSDVFANVPSLTPLTADNLMGARDKARKVVTGTADGPEAARESEANPDYQDWIGQIAAAAEKLAVQLRQQ